MRRQPRRWIKPPQYCHRLKRQSRLSLVIDPQLPVPVQILPHLRTTAALMDRYAQGVRNLERVDDMQTLTDSYRGLRLVMMLNWDRLIYLATIVVALMFGAWIGSL